jgi:hypothetical protein
MQIAFTAATEGKNGMFDYNVYEMSDITGGQIVTLAQHSGMIDDLKVENDGVILISADGKRYLVDSQTHTLRQE